MARNSSTSAPSASTTSATTWPGSACSSSGGEQQAGLRGAGVADGPTTGRRSRARRRACRRPSAPPAGRARRRRRAATSFAVSPADSSAAFHACTPEGHVADLAEPLVPDLRALLARRAPALDELVGDARRADELGDDRRRRRRRRRRTRRRRRRRAASSPLPGRPVRTSAGDHERGAGRPVERRAGARRPPSAPTRRSRTPARGVGSRSAAWIAVALVLSAYAGKVVANSSCAGHEVAVPRSARRAASTRHRGGVLVEATRPCGCPCRRPGRRRPRSARGRAAGTAGRRTRTGSRAWLQGT